MYILLQFLCLMYCVHSMSTKYSTNEMPVPPRVNGEARLSEPDMYSRLPLFENEEEQMYIIREAVKYGMEEAEMLYKNFEPSLYYKGVFLNSREPGRYLAIINALEPEGKIYAKVAHASIHATNRITKQLSLTKHQILFGLSSMNMTNSQLNFECPSQFRTPSCPPSANQYRTLDGSCNNIYYPSWGQAKRPFARLLFPDYHDGISQIRRSVTGKPLPSARWVSRVVHKDQNQTSSWASHLLMQWGQFLDHDLTFTPNSRGFNNSAIKCCQVDTEHLHPECLPIRIPPHDEFYSHYNQTCMEFVRSSPVPVGSCSLGPRNQLNQVTSYLDGSTIYGSSLKQSKQLRTNKKGLLMVSSRGLRQALLPSTFGRHDGCLESGNLFCFKAGDRRVNEQPGLASMHTLWVREHNRIARILYSLNRHWNDEKIFQESRRIVIAELQHITYNEFLPAVLSPTVMKLFGLELLQDGYFHDYSASVDPTVPNVFGAAAFRFGHSLVENKLLRNDKTFQPMLPDIPLNVEFMRPDVLHNFGEIDRLLLGLANQHCQRRDEYVTEQLTNHLFQQNEKMYGLDLVSLNIQRGRDHGLPSYVKWREYCGLHQYRSFHEFVGLMNRDTVHRLQRLYSSIEDIDLFPGGMAEKPVMDGLVGPTFACIIGQNFQRLRVGDRFWYENGGEAYSFSPAQLESIRRSSLARIMCDNLDNIESIQKHVMRMTDPRNNPRIRCTSSSLPSLDLSPWKEEKVEDLVKFSHFQTVLDEIYPQLLDEHKEESSFPILATTTKPKDPWMNFRPRPASIERIRSVEKIIGPRTPRLQNTSLHF